MVKPHFKRWTFVLLALLLSPYVYGTGPQSGASQDGDGDAAEVEDDEPIVIPPKIDLDSVQSYQSSLKAVRSAQALITYVLKHHKHYTDDQRQALTEYHTAMVAMEEKYRGVAPRPGQDIQDISPESKMDLLQANTAVAKNYLEVCKKLNETELTLSAENYYKQLESYNQSLKDHGLGHSGTKELDQARGKTLDAYSLLADQYYKKIKDMQPPASEALQFAAKKYADLARKHSDDGTHKSHQALANAYAALVETLQNPLTHGSHVVSEDGDPLEGPHTPGRHRSRPLPGSRTPSKAEGSQYLGDDDSNGAGDPMDAKRQRILDWVSQQASETIEPSMGSGSDELDPSVSDSDLDSLFGHPDLGYNFRPHSDRPYSGRPTASSRPSSRDKAILAALASAIDRTDRRAANLESELENWLRQKAGESARTGRRSNPSQDDRVYLDRRGRRLARSLDDRDLLRSAASRQLQHDEEDSWSNPSGGLGKPGKSRSGLTKERLQALQDSLDAESQLLDQAAQSESRDQHFASQWERSAASSGFRGEVAPALRALRSRSRSALDLGSDEGSRSELWKRRFRQARASTPRSQSSPELARAWAGLDRANQRLARSEGLMRKLKAQAEARDQSQWSQYLQELRKPRPQSSDRRRSSRALLALDDANALANRQIFQQGRDIAALRSKIEQLASPNTTSGEDRQEIARLRRLLNEHQRALEEANRRLQEVDQISEASWSDDGNPLPLGSGSNRSSLLAPLRNQMRKVQSMVKALGQFMRGSADAKEDQVDAWLSGFKKQLQQEREQFDRQMQDIKPDSIEALDARQLHEDHQSLLRELSAMAEDYGRHAQAHREALEAADRAAKKARLENEGQLKEKFTAKKAELQEQLERAKVGLVDPMKRHDQLLNQLKEAKTSDDEFFKHNLKQFAQSSSDQLGELGEDFKTKITKAKQCLDNARALNELESCVKHLNAVGTDRNKIEEVLKKQQEAIARGNRLVQGAQAKIHLFNENWHKLMQQDEEAKKVADESKQKLQNDLPRRGEYLRFYNTDEAIAAADAELVNVGLDQVLRLQNDHFSQAAAQLVEADRLKAKKAAQQAALTERQKRARSYLEHVVGVSKQKIDDRAGVGIENLEILRHSHQHGSDLNGHLKDQLAVQAKARLGQHSELDKNRADFERRINDALQVQDVPSDQDISQSCLVDLKEDPGFAALRSNLKEINDFYLNTGRWKDQLKSKLSEFQSIIRGNCGQDEDEVSGTLDSQFETEQRHLDSVLSCLVKRHTDNQFGTTDEASRGVEERIAAFIDAQKQYAIVACNRHYAERYEPALDPNKFGKYFTKIKYTRAPDLKPGEKEQDFALLRDPQLKAHVLKSVMQCHSPGSDGVIEGKWSNQESASQPKHSVDYTLYCSPAPERGVYFAPRIINGHDYFVGTPGTFKGHYWAIPLHQENRGRPKLLRFVREKGEMGCTPQEKSGALAMNEDLFDKKVGLDPKEVKDITDPSRWEAIENQFAAPSNRRCNRKPQGTGSIGIADYFGEDLFNYPKKMNTAQVTACIEGFLEKACKLHVDDILHRDIKPQNVLFDDSLSQRDDPCTIIDYGAAVGVEKDGFVRLGGFNYTEQYFPVAFSEGYHNVIRQKEEALLDGSLTKQVGATSLRVLGKRLEEQGDGGLKFTKDDAKFYDESIDVFQAGNVLAFLLCKLDSDPKGCISILDGEIAQLKKTQDSSKRNTIINKITQRLAAIQPSVDALSVTKVRSLLNVATSTDPRLVANGKLCFYGERCVVVEDNDKAWSNQLQEVQRKALELDAHAVEKCNGKPLRDEDNNVAKFQKRVLPCYANVLIDIKKQRVRERGGTGCTTRDLFKQGGR